MDTKSLNTKAIIRYDRVRGGWPLNQQFSDTVTFEVLSGETEKDAAIRCFREKHFPVARIISVDVLTSC